MNDFEYQEFAARVAHTLGVKRTDFGDEEWLLIESYHEIGADPEDAALIIAADLAKYSQIDHDD